MKYILTGTLVWMATVQLPAQPLRATLQATTKGKKIAATLPVKVTVPSDTAIRGLIPSAPLPPAPSAFMLPISDKAVRASYPLETAFGKSTHVIFPSNILYVDVGSDRIIADQPESLVPGVKIENVLRVKANKMGFEQTTLTVVTVDGRYYPFRVDYNEDPRLLNISIAGNLAQDQILAQEMGILQSSTPAGISLAENTLSVDELNDFSAMVIHRKRFLKDVGVMKMRMSFLLTGLYVHQKTMFLQITLDNRSEIDYDIDFFKFFIKDKDVTKRMAYQEFEVPTYAQLPASATRVPHQDQVTIVFALPMVTYAEEKVMEIQVYESKGGRHLRFELDSGVIIRAKGL